jgi:two-component system, chemotaxis family, protein-glutamate methylesterase/glutaminase
MNAPPTHDPVAKPRDLVVIGASAGGVEALKHVVQGFPPDLNAAVCVVLHIAPTSPSALASILERAGRLPCRRAEDGQPLQPGEIVVAPPDRHLAVEDGRVRLTVGPRENGHRPAVDVLFRSAAAARQERVVGVVLSGTRDDGAAGLAVIKANGGAAVVQNPADAMYPGMPISALASVAVDAIVPADRMGETIATIVRGEELPDDARPGSYPEAAMRAQPLTSVCPECGGVVTEQTQAGFAYWECHVGHRYSPTSFADAQAGRVEAALWTAVRALRDRAALLDRMAVQFEGRGQVRSARRFRQQAGDARSQAEAVRAALAEAAATALQEVSDAEGDHAEAASAH